MKHKPIECTLLLIAMFATTARSKEEYPIYVYPSQRAATPPKLDGVLDDACWKDAPVVGRFTYHNRTDLADAQTSFRVAYDDTCLYLGIVCDEPHMSKVAISIGARDSGVFSQESVEIFIEPNHDHGRYFQLGGNVGGALYDAEAFNTSFDCAAKFAVHVDKESWTTEWAIPLADLGIKSVRSGQVMGFNICRDRYVGGRTEWTNWSQTQGGFHTPVYFAHLVLSPTAEQLGELGEEFREGDREGPIQIFSAGGFSQTAYITLAKKQLATLQGLLKDLEETAKQESGKARGELQKRVDDSRREMQPYEEHLSSSQSLDAAAWGKMELRFHQIQISLGTVLWDARLAALLAEL